MKEEIESKTLQESTKATSVSEPAKQRQTTSEYEYIIFETRKMIKQGKYKNAFRRLDADYTNSNKLGTVTRIKMCRRILATIVSLSYRTLSKGEVQNPEKFVKLMEVGSNYIEQWHQNLLNFSIRTNTKFTHLQGILEEISANSEDEANKSYSRQNSRNSKLNSPIQPRAHFKNERQSVLLGQIKSQNQRDSSENALETSFTEGEAPAAQAEELSIKDLNITFHLDEFLNYYLLHIMNWGLFHKRLKNWNMSYRYFQMCFQITRKLEFSVNPNILYTCARVRIPLVSIYMEYERYKDAQDVLEGIVSILQLEFTLRFNRNSELKDQMNFIPRVRKTAKLMVIALLLSGKNYELLDNYTKIIESYKMAYWFCKRFIASDDELFKIVQKSYFKSKEDYGKHLEEIGEMERAVFESKLVKSKKNDTQAEEADRNSNFQKFNESLYKKFNIESLNKMRLPLKMSQKNLHAKGVQYADTVLDGAMSKTLHSVSTQPDLKALTNTDTASSDLKIGKSQSKRRKNEVKKFVVNGQTWTQIPSDKWKLADKMEYGDETNPEGKIAELQLTEEEELHFIEKLNRNIKLKRPASTDKWEFVDKQEVGVGAKSESKTARLGLKDDTEDHFVDKSSRTIKTKRPGSMSTAALTSRSSQGFTDIDSFFGRKVESKIEQDDAIKQKPKEFKNIVKNYVNFIQTEAFDYKEFRFCETMVNLRRRENLGDSLETGKYVAPATTRNLMTGPEYQREKRDIDTVGYVIYLFEKFVDLNLYPSQFIDTQTKVENTIQSRINVSKALTKPKTTKSKPPSTFTSPFLSPTRMLLTRTFSGVNDGPTKKPTDFYGEDDSKPSEKPKLNEILLKHRKILNLKTVANVVKENARRNNKEEYDQKSTQATERAGNDDLDTRFNQDTWRKINFMIKDRLTGMMEDIEKDLKIEERLEHRIKTNKPLFPERKKKEKFLRNLDDLAGSTRLLSAKRDASKKNLDFAELVRIQGRVKAEEKRKERANRRKTIFPGKLAFSPELESPMVSISVTKQE